MLKQGRDKQTVDQTLPCRIWFLFTGTKKPEAGRTDSDRGVHILLAVFCASHWGRLMLSTRCFVWTLKPLCWVETESERDLAAFRWSLSDWWGNFRAASQPESRETDRVGSLFSSSSCSAAEQVYTWSTEQYWFQLLTVRRSQIVWFSYFGNWLIVQSFFKQELKKM